MNPWENKGFISQKLTSFREAHEEQIKQIRSQSDQLFVQEWIGLNLK